MPPKRYIATEQGFGFNHCGSVKAEDNRANFGRYWRRQRRFFAKKIGAKAPISKDYRRQLTAGKNSIITLLSLNSCSFA